MSDISGGYEQRALDSLDTASKIERKIKQGYKITKKDESTPGPGMYSKLTPDSIQNSV